MIGKPQWFARRKYTGWGITPKTIQGWVYLASIIVPFVIFQALPFWTIQVRFYVTAAWLIFLIIDVTDIMLRLPKDEREKMHEAIAERNALWIIILVLIVSIGYQMYQSIQTQNQPKIDWFIIAALVLGVLAKSISNWYLDRYN